MSVDSVTSHATRPSDTAIASIPRDGLSYDGMRMPLHDPAFWNILWILETVLSFHDLGDACPEMAQYGSKQEIFTACCKYLQYVDYLGSKYVGDPVPIPMPVKIEQELRRLREQSKLRPIAEFMPSVSRHAPPHGSTAYLSRWTS